MLLPTEYTNAEMAAMCKAYERGETMPEIARSWATTPATISTILRVAKVKIRGRPPKPKAPTPTVAKLSRVRTAAIEVAVANMTDEQKCEVVEVYQQGMQLSRISRRYGLTADVIHYLRHNHKTPDFLT